MLSSNSTFLKTDIPVTSNAIKSLIFKLAELLLCFAVYKTFSLIAAAQKSFTTYLVFAENPIQKALFAFSRGISKESVLITSFVAALAVSDLFGTVLWALDAPGFVIQKENVTANTVAKYLRSNPSYVVSHEVDLGNINATDAKLAEILSANLFQAGLSGPDFSLTGTFIQGVPESMEAPRIDIFTGPRIWLDGDGFSVTTSAAHLSGVLGTPDEKELVCLYADIDKNNRFLNCTFKNEWVPALLDDVTGIPQVHWDETADAASTMTSIGPAKRDDPWAATGKQGTMVIRFHMFTVTKGTRRHTFLMTTFKASLVAYKGQKIQEAELKNFISRTMGPDPAEQKKREPETLAILNMSMTAQERSKSAGLGFKVGRRNEVGDSFWELLTMESQQKVNFRVFRFTNMNITLLKSETISRPLIPYEACDTAFANKAFGGKVVTTDCLGHGNWPNGSRFLGQADSSAIFHLYGPIAEGAATSLGALNPEFISWCAKNWERVSGLLLSRGYILGLDPSLVTVEMGRAQPAISPLQILLGGLAAVLALMSWGLLYLCASSHYGSSLLINLVATTGADPSQASNNPGYSTRLPDIRLEARNSDVVLKTQKGSIVLKEDYLSGPQTGEQEEVAIKVHVSSAKDR